MGDKRFKATSILILVILAGLWLLPIYAMVNTSIKSQQEVAAQEYLRLPRRVVFKNYLTAFRALSTDDRLVVSLLLLIPRSIRGGRLRLGFRAGRAILLRAGLLRRCRVHPWPLH